MAAETIRVFIFLIVAHSLVFYGMQSGMLEAQTGSNPHENFVQQFTSGEFIDTVAISDTSGIISGTVALASRAINFIGFVAGAIFSPYVLITLSPMPFEFKFLTAALLGFMETAAVAYFIRGIS